MGGRRAQELIRVILDRPGLFEVFEADSFDRDDIQSELAVSRSTTHRLARKLDDSGIIERTNGGYTTTAFGEIVADEIEQCMHQIDTARTIEPILGAVQDADEAVDLEPFTGAKVIQDADGDASDVEQYLIDAVENADTILSASQTIVSHRYLSTLFDRMANGASVEMVSTGDVIDFISTAHPGEQELYRTDGSPRLFRNDQIPITVVIADDHACLGVARQSVPQLDRLVSMDDRESVEWAESLYRTIKSEATPYHPSSGNS